MVWCWQLLYHERAIWLWINSANPLIYCNSTIVCKNSPNNRLLSMVLPWWPIPKPSICFNKFTDSYRRLFMFASPFKWNGAIFTRFISVGGAVFQWICRTMNSSGDYIRMLHSHLFDCCKMTRLGSYVVRFNYFKHELCINTLYAFYQSVYHRIFIFICFYHHKTPHSVCSRVSVL